MSHECTSSDCYVCGEGHSVEEAEAKVLADIIRDGWSDMAIFPVEGEDGELDGLPFNYTVGMAEHGHPDLITIGMGNELMHKVLQVPAGHIMRGRAFLPNTYSSEVLENYQVAFLPVDDVMSDEFPMTMTMRLYGERFTAMQLVWPDKSNRFPWHWDYDDELKPFQPLLGRWKGD